MASVAATIATHHNHVERVSVSEWEDEAYQDQSSPENGNAEGSERPTKPKHLRHAAAALRSSLTALRPGSASVPKASSSGRRESSTGFVGSLLHGLANAVGLHRENSPARVSSALDLSIGRSKAASGHSLTIRRLGSAAMMRAEIQTLSQFGDLRNDSFTSRSCAKLRRRSSLLLPRLSDASISLPAPAPVPGNLTPASGDLDRRSAPALPTCNPSHRLTCPGELPDFPSDSAAGCSYDPAGAVATSAAIATPPVRGAASPFQSSAATADVAGSSGPSGIHARRSSSSGIPQLHSSLVVEIPSLPMASPHPPSHPPAQTRPSSSLSPLPSRSTSSEHLPPMTPLSTLSSAVIAAIGGVGPLLSVRDRPPTPRGQSTTTSPSSTLAKVLGSFHLPEILTPGSGRSVTERRSSVAGNSSGASFTRPGDMGMPRSRRNSVCSGMSITGSVGFSGPSVTGPGGAAISASLAKRAAAAATAAAANVSPLATPPSGSGTLSSPVAPSGSSCSNQHRISVPSGTVRAGSGTKMQGSILEEFQNSMELDEDNALAAVDAEFDRRFCQPLPDVPGAVDGASPAATQRAAPQHPQLNQLQPLNHLNQPQPPQPPVTPSPPPVPQHQPLAPEIIPRAPASERGAQQPAPRRGYAMVDIVVSPAATAGAAAATASATVTSTSCPPISPATRRAVLPAAAATFDGPDCVGADNVLLSSTEASPTFECNSNKMRLASIRLSYAEGIVLTGGSGPRTSLELPPAAALSARGPSATWTPQPPPGLAPPLSGRPMGPAHATAAGAGAAAL